MEVPMPKNLSLLLLVFCALTQSAQRAHMPFHTRGDVIYHQQRQTPAPSPARIPVTKSLESSLSRAQFAEIIEKFSEPNGYFDTDNLISNESSYLHVLGKMRQMKISGGAYLGVGPDQSFSYIAQIRPEIVFIVDIRRDNLLQHFLFKSLFQLSHNRM